MGAGCVPLLRQLELAQRLKPLLKAESMVFFGAHKAFEPFCNCREPLFPRDLGHSRVNFHVFPCFSSNRGLQVGCSLSYREISDWIPNGFQPIEMPLCMARFTLRRISK